jgi:hypothetical protein
MGIIGNCTKYQKESGLKELFLDHFLKLAPHEASLKITTRDMEIYQ